MAKAYLVVTYRSIKDQEKWSAYAKLAAQGIEVTGGTPESLQAELAEEVAKWGRVIAEANIKPE